MKRYLFLITLIMIGNTLFAQDIINIFYLGEKICGPVLIKTGIGDFYVENGTQINGNLTHLEAWDCNGNKIIDTTPDKREIRTNGPTTRIYWFEYLYPSSNNSQENTYSENNYNEYQPEPSVQQKAVETTLGVAQHFGNSAIGLSGISADGYPNFQVAAGLSRTYGEFARLKVHIGGAGGFVLYGGVGKDWIFNGENKDKLSWHAAIGYFMALGYDTNQDLTLGICYAETPVIKGGTLNLDLTYSYFFGDKMRFGVFGGGAIGVGNVKEVMESTESEKFPGKIVWDLHLGIAFKLWQQ